MEGRVMGSSISDGQGAKKKSVKKAPKSGQKRGKRQCRPDSWEVTVVKKKRNLGEEYVSRNSKKVVPKKVMGSPCKDGCFERIGIEQCEKIFKSYWGLGNYDLQTAYLLGCVSKKKTPEGASKKTFTGVYMVQGSEGFKEKVCRKAFENIHGISAKRVQYLSKKMSEGGTPIADRRGGAPGAGRKKKPKPPVIQETPSSNSVPQHRKNAIEVPIVNQSYVPDTQITSQVNPHYPVLEQYRYEDFMFVGSSSVPVSVGQANME